jgi:hypothetical protein
MPLEPSGRSILREHLRAILRRARDRRRSERKVPSSDPAEASGKRQPQVKSEDDAKTSSSRDTVLRERLAQDLRRLLSPRLIALPTNC